MKERSHCSHFYTEDKLIMTFLHRLSESFCMGDAISFTGKAAYKQGAQDLTVIMYWIKLTSWSMLPWSIWLASPAIPTISLISQWSHHFQLGKALLREQGVHSLVPDLYFRWILSAFYSFLKNTYKVRFTSAYKTPGIHEHLLHL